MTSAQQWASRAASAAEAVDLRFGHRLLGLPGTWLGRISTGTRSGTEWHYWWQAHYLDCLIDAGWREFQTAGSAASRNILKKAKAFPRTIWLRNFFRLRNSYFDDMAWLALASLRANALTRKAEGKPFPQARAIRRVLGKQLHSALSTELGGGMYWSKRRDYKNSAVNGPGALYFARTGDGPLAQRILDWMRRELWQAELGLYIDGVHLRASGPEREDTIWSYNQGPVLAALCALPTTDNLDHAAELILGVERGLCQDGVLRLHGEGDPGLFTGILVRHLATAARQELLPPASRAAARRMVLNTAEALWASRSAAGPALFSKDLQLSADRSYPPGSAVPLSVQLQAWMIFEMAYRLASA
ncbi:putative alpha-1,6-mannanase (GH76 family) [Psychromicrobium silvestre]|uniref:Putative alpha-1,6-mannanase (GH76 family) n=1 Tax=Psychromicrobium silvestre TaxID=1645614 RepID=A0A7Y9LUG7_9MICC|nr:glycoside hydrolase family 76 protein [Psychromicrobium silvestre]NYE95843.1 putative alpha-1,6-mannanase (GH76 family) [Psychromicrobium silvestre]